MRFKSHSGAGRIRLPAFLWVCLALLAACQPRSVPLPVITLTSTKPGGVGQLPTRTPSAEALLLATFTPLATATPLATQTRLPTPTRFPTWTPFPTATPSYTPSVTPTPSDTPPPPPDPATPVTPSPTLLQLPTAIPQGSKMGLHVIQNNSPLIMDFVRQTHPAVMKAVGDVGWLTEVKSVSPETVTIGRLMAASQDIGGDPVQAARDFVAEQLSDYLLNPGVDYWEGWNEPDPDLDMNWYAAFEAERVRQLGRYGLRAAVGGFSAGVPEYSQFFSFLLAIETARQYGGLLSLHEYAAPTLDYLYGDPLPGLPTYPNRGPLALRYRWWYEDVLIPRGSIIPLVISEAGIDGIVMSGQRPGPAGLGWQDFVAYWESLGLGSGTQAYISQLAWYDAQVQSDSYVIGFTLFTAGGGDLWRTYEVNAILPDLAAYVLQSRP